MIAKTLITVIVRQKKTNYQKQGIYVNRENIILIAVLTGAALLVGAYFCFRFLRFLEKRRTAKMRKQGAKGEKKAYHFLKKHGFTIIEEQPERNAVLYVDGKALEYRIRADFMVERNGVYSIVEVKTGRKATNPASSHTRRQLFEYSHLYHVDQLLFFNAETGKLNEITFGNEITKDKNKFTPVFITFIIGVLVGIAAAIALYKKILCVQP